MKKKTFLLFVISVMFVYTQTAGAMPIDYGKTGKQEQEHDKKQPSKRKSTLSSSKTKSVMAVLLLRLKSPDPLKQEQAYNAIMKLGPGAAKYMANVLAQMKGSDSVVMRCSAASLLARLASGGIFDSRILSVLNTALKNDPVLAVRLSCAEALGKSGGARDRAVLMNIADDPTADTQLRIYAAAGAVRLGNGRYISFVRSMINDSDPDTRLSAVYNLGEIGGKKEISLLKTILEKYDEDTRKFVKTALSKIAKRILARRRMLRRHKSAGRR